MNDAHSASVASSNSSTNRVLFTTNSYAANESSAIQEQQQQQQQKKTFTTTTICTQPTIILRTEQNVSPAPMPIAIHHHHHQHDTATNQQQLLQLQQHDQEQMHVSEKTATISQKHKKTNQQHHHHHHQHHQPFSMIHVEHVDVSGGENEMERGVSPPPLAATTIGITSTSTSPNMVSNRHLSPSSSSSADWSAWSNMDTYLHIFLTFYFGHFAALLFFDGILRSVGALFTLEHASYSPLIYMTHIVFSIGYLAFTVWFMTVCWRWWRHKSLEPYRHNHNQNSQVNRRYSSRSMANAYVWLAVFILIVGWFIFVIIGLVDVNYKCRQAAYDRLYASPTSQQRSSSSAILPAHSSSNNNNNNYYKWNNYESSCATDWAVYVFRLVFWLVGVVATLLLARNSIVKHVCPSRHIRIDKERPTTIYQVTY